MHLNLVYITLQVSLKPFKDRREQKFEVINETFCLLTLYLFLCFTGLIEEEEIITVFVLDGKARNQIGLTLIAITLLNFLVDFTTIIYDIKISIRNMCHNRKVRKIMR